MKFKDYKKFRTIKIILAPRNFYEWNEGRGSIVFGLLIGFFVGLVLL